MLQRLSRQIPGIQGFAFAEMIPCIMLPCSAYHAAGIMANLQYTFITCSALKFSDFLLECLLFEGHYSQLM